MVRHGGVGGVCAAVPPGLPGLLWHSGALRGGRSRPASPSGDPARSGAVGPGPAAASPAYQETRWRGRGEGRAEEPPCTLGAASGVLAVWKNSRWGRHTTDTPGPQPLWQPRLSVQTGCPEQPECSCRPGLAPRSFPAWQLGQENSPSSLSLDLCYTSRLHLPAASFITSNPLCCCVIVRFMNNRIHPEEQEPHGAPAGFV